jgi:hypothetical protein
VVSRRYWAHDIPSADQLTGEDRRDFGFLESAFREGHQPFDLERTVLGARACNGREGEIIRRGGRGRYWEVVLSDNGERVKSAFVDGFDAASIAVLSWLRGVDCSAAIGRIEYAIVTRPGERGW